VPCGSPRPFLVACPTLPRTAPATKRTRAAAFPDSPALARCRSDFPIEAIIGIGAGGGLLCCCLLALLFFLLTPMGRRLRGGGSKSKKRPGYYEEVRLRRGNTGNTSGQGATNFPSPPKQTPRAEPPAASTPRTPAASPRGARTTAGSKGSKKLSCGSSHDLLGMAGAPAGAIDAVSRKGSVQSGGHHASTKNIDLLSHAI